MPRRRSYERLSPPLLHESRRRSVGGNDAERIAFTQRRDAELGSANLYRVRQNGFKHRLKFAGRARDDPQYLAGRGLLLQRLGQFARARLHFVEQTHVLNRDHGLVGESGDKLDLLLGERTDGRTLQYDHSDSGSVANERNAKCRANARAVPQRVIWISLNVHDVNHFSFEHGAPRDRTAVRGDWVIFDVFTMLGRIAIRGNLLKKLSFT